ncbi:MAG: hypothetical protein QNJ47_23940 [Nostocaceae cyanobacterium]|nr:hypothetical protein [Nostocaceae cyanobacterium]
MWETLGLYALINKWRFLQPTNSEIFRISHFLDGDIISKPRATIATGFIDGNSQVNTFKPSSFSPRKDFQIFELTFPAGLPSHSLGFIRIDDGPGNWIVKVEAFRSNSVEDDFANYLLARFGITGSLFTGMVKQDLIPVSSSIELQPGFTPQLLVPANPNRAYLRIRAQGSPVYIWADKFNEDGQPLILLEEVDKGKTIPLPVVNDGIYKGAIYAQVTKKVNVDWTEYSYPQISQ